MDSVLIVTASEQNKEFFNKLLFAVYVTDITFVNNCAEARRIVSQKDFDVILVNTPLSDEFGYELAEQLTQNTTSGIMLIVKSDIADAVFEKVADYGVLVISKPISRQLFYQSLRLVAATRARMLHLRNENIKLKNKVEEIRIINRAKCILIQYLSMTEPQAHRYLEKQAMDMRMTKLEVAKRVLNTYDNY